MSAIELSTNNNVNSAVTSPDLPEIGAHPPVPIVEESFAQKFPTTATTATELQDTDATAAVEAVVKQVEEELASSVTTTAAEVTTKTEVAVVASLEERLEDAAVVATTPATPTPIPVTSGYLKLGGILGIPFMKRYAILGTLDKCKENDETASSKTIRK
jgi:hypothetical protein